MQKILNPPPGTKEIHFETCSDGFSVAYICDDEQREIYNGITRLSSKDTDTLSAITNFAFNGIQAQTLPKRF